MIRGLPRGAFGAGWGNMEATIQENFRPKIEARIAELDATIRVNCFRRTRR